MIDATGTPVRSGDLVVIGGGCYGSFHARQLDRARERGALECGDLVIVDRDPDCPARSEFAGRPGFRFVTAGWVDYLGRHVAAAGPDDFVIPTPLGPHLAFEWLAAHAEARGGGGRVERGRLAALPATPYAERNPGGGGWLSFATWVCPIACIEPAVCPETRGPKWWEMDEAVFSFSRGLSGSGVAADAVEVFRCRYHAFGIAAWPVAAAVAARDRLDHLLALPPRPDGRPRRMLVATVSSCHGVLDALDIHPA